MAAIRAGLIASSLLVSVGALLWPEAVDELRRFFAPIETGFRQVTERAMHWPRESLNKSPSVAPKDVEPVPTHPSGGVETVQVFKGDQIERRSMSPKGVKKPIQVFRGSVVTLQGPARTVDGDTLDMGGVRVRLYGIDAPETAQSCRLEGRRWPCGRYATQALRSQIGNREVTCEERGRDSYSRLVAACSVGGRDLSAWMIGEGWALAYRQYSLAYMAEESRARAARRGVWQGEFVAPHEWRKGRRLGH